jgi:hypothetical protein
MNSAKLQSVEFITQKSVLIFNSKTGSFEKETKKSIPGVTASKKTKGDKRFVF